jgi:hypothetical protein
MIIRPPRWYRALYSGSFIVCLVIGLVAAFAVRGTTGVVFGGTFLLLAASFLVIAVMSLTRRLELRDDRLYAVLITGTHAIAVSEIGSMRFSPAGNGQSRCGFFRRDGTAAFGPVRRAWPTADLLRLAKAINVPVESV